MVKLSVSEVKTIRSLSQKKYRDALGLFVVEGEKLLEEALDAGFCPEKIYRREEISEEQMRRISSQDSPSPVLAVLRKAEQTDFVLSDSGLFLGLDSISDPGNLGTILRICDWFGIDGVFASANTVDQYNPKVVQASMGAIFRHTLYYCNLEELCMKFRSKGLPVYGTQLDGKNIYKSSLGACGLILMGNESRGLDPKLRELCTEHLLIPSFAGGAHAESLNVAIATALTIAEFKRQNNIL